MSVFTQREEITYIDTVHTAASEVQVGDLLFGLRVYNVVQESEWIWRIEADNETNADKASAGIVMHITGEWPVAILRMLTLGVDQCIRCKRHGIKYAAQHKCNACYQRERRQTLQAS